MCPPWSSRESWLLVVLMIDSIHCLIPPRFPEPGFLVFAVAAHEGRVETGHELFELGAGEAFVGSDDLAALQQPLFPGRGQAALPRLPAQAHWPARGRS
jgi:hypothetical protein